MIFAIVINIGVQTKGHYVEHIHIRECVQM